MAAPTNAQRKIAVRAIITNFQNPANLAAMLGVPAATAQTDVVAAIVTAIGTNADASLLAVLTWLKTTLTAQVVTSQAQTVALQTALAAITPD